MCVTLGVIAAVLLAIVLFQNRETVKGWIARLKGA